MYELYFEPMSEIVPYVPEHEERIKAYRDYLLDECRAEFLTRMRVPKRERHLYHYIDFNDNETVLRFLDETVKQDRKPKLNCHFVDSKIMSYVQSGIIDELSQQALSRGQFIAITTNAFIEHIKVNQFDLAPLLTAWQLARVNRNDLNPASYSASRAAAKSRKGTKISATKRHYSYVIKALEIKNQNPKYSMNQVKSVLIDHINSNPHEWPERYADSTIIRYLESWIHKLNKTSDN